MSEDPLWDEICKLGDDIYKQMELIDREKLNLAKMNNKHKELWIKYVSIKK